MSAYFSKFWVISIAGGLFSYANVVIGAYADSPGPLQDEAYNLTVSDSGIVLSAATQLGALWGLQTMSQLLHGNESGCHIHGIPLVIKDKPNFRYRGMLVRILLFFFFLVQIVNGEFVNHEQIDSARHFLPIRTILRFIDQMSMYKFNILHWHVVDAQVCI